MASLTGQSVASSYEQLLHVDRDGGGNGTTLVDLKDGDNGTTFALQLATDKINVTGRLGVGTTNPEANLSFEPALVTTSTEGIKFQNAGDTNDAIIQPWRFGSGMGIVLGSNFFLNTSGAVSRFKDADESVGVLLDPRGTLDIYTGASGVDATSKFTIANDGTITLPQGQLKFPASQNASSDANTLDDYEEGTWVAVNSEGLSLTLEQNKYVKVGKLVTATMIVTFPGTSNSATASLSLPITADTISGASGGAVLEQNISSSQSYTACVNGADSCIFRLRGVTSQTNADLSGKKIRFVITYHSA